MKKRAYILIAVSLVLAYLIYYYVSVVSNESQYDSRLIKPFFPSNKYLVGALGIGESGWNMWAVEKLLEQGPEPEIVDLLEERANLYTEFPNSSISRLLLFKFRVDPHGNLRKVFDSLFNTGSMITVNTIGYVLDESDAEYVDIYIEYLNEYPDEFLIQLAGRIALNQINYPEELWEELNLKDLSEIAI